MQPAWKPAPGQVALIELSDDGQCLTGVVMKGERGAVAVNVGTSAGPPSPREVLVSFFSPDALYRVRATASPRGDQEAIVDLTVHEVERVQRRASQRVRTAVPAALTAFDDQGRFACVVGETVDVGPGGCRVRAPQRFPESLEPTVSLRLPDGSTVVVPGRLLESEEADDDRWSHRVAFSSVPEAERTRLAGFSAQQAPTS